jgi:hypothetical protein
MASSDIKGDDADVIYAYKILRKFSEPKLLPSDQLTGVKPPMIPFDNLNNIEQSDTIFEYLSVNNGLAKEIGSMMKDSDTDDQTRIAVTLIEFIKHEWNTAVSGEKTQELQIPDRVDKMINNLNKLIDPHGFEQVTGTKCPDGMCPCILLTHPTFGSILMVLVKVAGPDSSRVVCAFYDTIKKETSKLYDMSAMCDTFEAIKHRLVGVLSNIFEANPAIITMMPVQKATSVLLEAKSALDNMVAENADVNAYVSAFLKVFLDPSKQ